MEWDNLHELLRSLYDDMMPLAGDMAAVAKGLAGLGALFYVALKVWQALSRAEPIDMFPLLRPFALGLCIMFFPTIVLGTINAVLSPVVTGTHSILEDQVLDLNKLQQQKDQLEYEAMVRNPETAWVEKILLLHPSSGRFAKIDTVGIEVSKFRLVTDDNHPNPARLASEQEVVGTLH